MSRPQNRAPSDESNPWRNEIVQTIFGDVGNIIKDFSCAIERQILLQGRMYITDRNICFYSNLFGFEKKIKIPFHAITNISKEYTASVIPNAICIKTSKREYVFRSFWDREEAFTVIMHCYRPEKGVAAVVHGRPRREDNVGRATVIGVLGEGDSSNTPLNRVTSEGAVEAAMEAMAEQAMEVQSPPTAHAKVVGSDDGEGLPAVKERASETIDDLEEGSMDGDQAGMGADTVISPAVAFRQAVDRRSYKFQGVSGVAYKNTSVKQWTHSFLAEELESNSESQKSSFNSSRGGSDDGNSSRTSSLSESNHGPSDDIKFGPAADLGQPAFHLQNGDSEVEVGEWKNMPESKAFVNAGIRSRVRTYQFRTPIVGSPIGPSSTRATKTQCWRSYGSAGLIIESVIVLEDIPYGDCFEVEDRWVIAPINPDKPEEGGVTLDIGFEVKWKKSTLFKRAIEARTKVDTAEFYTKYAAAMIECLEKKQTGKLTNQAPEKKEVQGEKVTASQSTPIASLPLTPAPSPATSNMVYLFGTMLLALLIINLWYEKRSSAYVSQLAEQVNELKELIKELQTATSSQCNGLGDA